MRTERGNQIAVVAHHSLQVEVQVQAWQEIPGLWLGR